MPRLERLLPMCCMALGLYHLALGFFFCHSGSCFASVHPLIPPYLEDVALASRVHPCVFPQSVPLAGSQAVTQSSLTWTTARSTSPNTTRLQTDGKFGLLASTYASTWIPHADRGKARLAPFNSIVCNPGGLGQGLLILPAGSW